MITIMTGTMNHKHHCHEALSVTTPPIRGPRPFPTATEAPIKPLYFPRSLRVVTSLAMIMTSALLCDKRYSLPYNGRVKRKDRSIHGTTTQTTQCSKSEEHSWCCGKPCNKVAKSKQAQTSQKKRFPTKYVAQAAID